ncbi:MAG: hypothetical protein EOO90_24925 [Pedobacter sp.]|nr:MAG: hypothetical protein EOO90_24925 [Pedobacter sp.]
MKQKLIVIISHLIIVLLVQNSWAQSTPSTAPPKTNTVYKKTQIVPKRKSTFRIDTVKNTDFSLNGQYQFMLSRSKTINGYKLINPGRLTSVWQSVSDTLRKERLALNSAQKKSLELENTIKGLQSEITGQEATLNNSDAKMNQISFLGISFQKNTYHIIVWSIIVLLALGLLTIIIRSAKSIAEAKHRTQLYDEVSSEYQAFKSKANEQQRKLARELQDERNIVEELKNNRS